MLDNCSSSSSNDSAFQPTGCGQTAHISNKANNQQHAGRRSSPVRKQRKQRRVFFKQPYEKKMTSSCSYGSTASSPMVGNGGVNTNSSVEVMRSKSGNLGLNGVKLSSEVEDISYELNNLLKAERAFARNPLLLYQETTAVADNIDGTMRDEEVFNLRFLQAYYNLRPETFATAVSIIDHFIMKVRVKPKYMACLATAAYHMAVLLHESPEDRPSKEELVALTHCGGTTEDLGRMIDIIQTKLNQEQLECTTAIDFARVLVKKCPQQSWTQGMLSRVFTRILVAMTSLYIYQFPPQIVALASFLLEAENSEVIDWLEDNMVKFCGATMTAVELCAEYLQRMFTLCYQRVLPSSRDRLVWSLSRRTRSRLSSLKSSHLDEKLYPIMESNEVEPCEA